jgi:hypothetical protein
VLERYSAGEGAVVRKFFSQPRTPAEYLKIMGDIAEDELQHGPAHIHEFVEAHVHTATSV